MGPEGLKMHVLASAQGGTKTRQYFLYIEFCVVNVLELNMHVLALAQGDTNSGKYINFWKVHICTKSTFQGTDF